jgi:hypothetical protein
MTSAAGSSPAKSNICRDAALPTSIEHSRPQCRSGELRLLAKAKDGVEHLMTA